MSETYRAEWEDGFVQAKQMIRRRNGQLGVSFKLIRGARYKEKSVVREQDIVFNHKDVVGGRKHAKCFAKSIEHVEMGCVLRAESFLKLFRYKAVHLYIRHRWTKCRSF